MRMKNINQRAAVLCIAALLGLTACRSETQSGDAALQQSDSGAQMYDEGESGVSLGEYKGLKVTVERLDDVTDAEVEA